MRALCGIAGPVSQHTPLLLEPCYVPNSSADGEHEINNEVFRNLSRLRPLCWHLWVAWRQHCGWHLYALNSWEVGRAFRNANFGQGLARCGIYSSSPQWPALQTEKRDTRNDDQGCGRSVDHRRRGSAVTSGGVAACQKLQSRPSTQHTQYVPSGCFVKDPQALAYPAYPKPRTWISYATLQSLSQRVCR